jgi:hypothetical protein
MNAVETLGRRLSLLLAAAGPVLAAAQPLTTPDGPPGGVASAWPLGLIVALVAAVFALGALAGRRRRRAAGRGAGRR